MVLLSMGEAGGRQPARGSHARNYAENAQVAETVDREGLAVGLVLGAGVDAIATYALATEIDLDRRPLSLRRLPRSEALALRNFLPLILPGVKRADRVTGSVPRS